MLDSFLLRVLRAWWRRTFSWRYRLRMLGSFPTIWRAFCNNCSVRRWIVGNDEWHHLCMGCLTGFSRSALLEWGPGQGRMHDSQECERIGDLGRFGRQLCNKRGDNGQGEDSES